MITVSGAGAATAPPDVVRIRLGVTASRPNAATAVSDAEAAVRRVREALAVLGVPNQDATTESLSVQAEQVWTEQQGPRITGFRADHELLVLLRELSGVGRVLGEVLVAGGDDVRLHGVEFGLADDTPLRALARDAAWADAVGRAEQLAGLAGRELGAVLSITEGAVPVPGPRTRDRMVSAAKAEVDVRPGAVAVEVTLTVQWQLG
jgi:uncharacterized protein YggE